MIRLTKLDTADELAEALYYAHASAILVASDHPHAAPKSLEWEELEPAARELWLHTARRLVALNG